MKGGMASKRSRQDLEKALAKVLAEHQALRNEWRGHSNSNEEDCESVDANSITGIELNLL